MAYEPVLLAGADDPEFVNIEAYLAAGGYETARKVLAEMSPDDCVGLVKESGLRGRGGAGFPTGMKWSFLPKDSDKPTYIVVNADESEPGTFKDRFLLERNPHLMLEGIIITAWACRSNQAYIYLRGEFPHGYEMVRRAIAQAEAKGFLGDECFGLDFKLRVGTYLGAGAYICGEETGLLESLEGKRGHPRNKPPFPALVGLFNCPTIINNVESLAVLPPLFARGVDWFKSLGHERNFGPKLWCVSGLRSVAIASSRSSTAGTQGPEAMNSVSSPKKGRARWTAAGRAFGDRPRAWPAPPGRSRPRAPAPRGSGGPSSRGTRGPGRPASGRSPRGASRGRGPWLRGRAPRG